MASVAQMAMDRAAERIVEDTPVTVVGQPISTETVQGLVGLVPVRAEEPETASVSDDLSGLWNLTAAAPRRRVAGPSLQELDDAADEMVAAVATQLGRVAGFAARNLGGVTVTASGLSTFQNVQGPGTPRQAAVSADDLGVIQDAWIVVTDDVLAPKIAADYLAGAKGQHDRLAAALPPKVRGLAGRPLLDAPALLHAAGAANRLKGIGDELWQAARTALLEGMAKGESVAKLARRVRDATGVSIGRATTIARTESMAARSAGSYEEMLASGVVVSKTWQATGDLRTRPTHVVADGQTVPMAAKFTVGGWPADRPHDSLLPAEESVNCRCTLTYNVDTDVATAVNASGAADDDDDNETASGLWTFHLAGKHNQQTHAGGSGGGPGTGFDYIAAGQADTLAQSAYGAAGSALPGRTLYRGGTAPGIGPNGDEALHAIVKEQAFDVPMAIASPRQMKKGIRRGDLEMFRGVNGSFDGSKTPAQVHEAMRHGAAYQGLGAFGNGSYFSGSRDIAASYGKVGRYALHRDARTVDYDDLLREQGKFLDKVGRDSVTGRVFGDPGRYAAARGFDAIHVKRIGQAKGGENEYVILNRGAVIAEI